MADVRKERRLGSIDLGQRLGAPSLLLIGLRVGNRPRNLSSDETEEASIIIIEQADGTEANDQNAGPSCFASWLKRHHSCLIRGMRPWPSWDLRAQDCAQIRNGLQALRAQRLCYRP